MQPQENPARVLQGLHGESSEVFLLKNLYCLECRDLLHYTLYNGHSKQDMHDMYV